jgi:hypothetical protein
MKRNRLFWFPDNNRPNHYKCDICEEETKKPSDYFNSHVIAHAHARTLAFARESNRRLPTSPSYDCNGLFLCGQCDSHFEDHWVKISGDGTIWVDDRAQPRRIYEPLNNAKVKWADLIDEDVAWPNSATFEFRKTLSPVCSDHRKLEFGVEEDDVSVGSESEDVKEAQEANELSSSTKKRKISAESKTVHSLRK